MSGAKVGKGRRFYRGHRTTEVVKVFWLLKLLSMPMEAACYFRGRIRLLYRLSDRYRIPLQVLLLLDGGIDKPYANPE